MYTIEHKRIDRPNQPWEPMESTWEISNQFSVAEVAEGVARMLALRENGDVAFRVVDAQGRELVTVHVTRYLRVSRPHSLVQCSPEVIPAGLTIPMVSQMLNDTHMRARVFLTKAEFSGARAERLSTTTTLPAAPTLQDTLSPTPRQKHQVQATQAEHGGLPFLRNQLPRLSEVAQHLRAALQGDERDLPAGQRECCTYAVASALQQAEDAREQLETTLCALALTLSFSEAQALHRMLTTLSERLDDWLEFDEGCTCDESEPEELCLSCASLEAQSSASQWLQALALVLAPGCAATTEEKGG